MLVNLCLSFCRLLFFFQNKLVSNIASGIPSGCQFVSRSFGSDQGPNCSKDHQQRPKFAASRQRVKKCERHYNNSFDINNLALSPGLAEVEERRVLYTLSALEQV